jgi:hypothetical protein
VISKATDEFWAAFNDLPTAVQRQARAKFQLWRENPFHPSLRFKRLAGTDLYSVRINRDYRALAWQRDEMLIWFWIGSHDEYEKQITRG